MDKCWEISILANFMICRLFLKKLLTSFFYRFLIIFCQQLYLTEKKHIYRGKKKIGNLSLYNKIYMNEIRVHAG